MHLSAQRWISIAAHDPKKPSLLTKIAEEKTFIQT